MPNEQFMRDVVTSVVADADVHPVDLNGGGDHWFCAVVSASFEGQRSFQRQRPILAAFTPHIQSGVVHALDLKCITPTELEQQHDGKIPAPFIPHQQGQGSHPNSW